MTTYSSAPSHRNGSSSIRSDGRIHILLVDDHPAIRSALADTAADKLDMEICGEADSAGEALRQIDELKPDVAVVDISLADAHGLDLVQKIRAQYPDIRVMVFSMHDEEIYAERAISAGASGYLMKGESTQNVIDAIRRIHDGHVYLSRHMNARILGKLAPGDGGAGPQFAIDELTERERTVFRMLGEGYKVEEIEQRLELTRKTVETYRRRAKEKLGMESVNDLLQYAMQWTRAKIDPEEHPRPGGGVA